MSGDGLKLSVYFGESDRSGEGLLSDALMDHLGRHGVAASVLLRGVEGFGIKHQLRTDRLLTLSEDLPLIAVAVDAPERIEALVPGVLEMVGDGLVILERIAIGDGAVASPSDGDEEVKLTVYCGRSAQREGRPVVWSALHALRASGMPGATAFTGLDGTIRGERRRARFFGRNSGVPAMILSVGPRGLLDDVIPRLRRALGPDHVLTLERVHVVRQDGRVLGDLPGVPARDPAGLAMWLRVSVFAGERERWEGAPLHSHLLQRLRERNAAGATALRGFAGYSGAGPLHADRLLALRRRTPMLMTMVDSVEEVQRLWPAIARATSATGLVTCEVVPSFRAVGPAGSRGGLRLADTTAA